MLRKELNYLGSSNILGTFYGTVGGWDTEPVNLGQNPGSKPFNSKDYPVSIINRETFCKEIKCLVKIVVLTPVK